MFFLALDEKIKKARNILWEYEINPYVGVENLCWAPNVNPDQHNDEHIRIIAEELIALHEKKCSRDDVIEYLEKMKKFAKDLWKNYNKGEK